MSNDTMGLKLKSAIQGATPKNNGTTGTTGQTGQPGATSNPFVGQGTAKTLRELLGNGQQRLATGGMVGSVVNETMETLLLINKRCNGRTQFLPIENSRIPIGSILAFQELEGVVYYVVLLIEKTAEHIAPKSIPGMYNREVEFLVTTDKYFGKNFKEITDRTLGGYLEHSGVKVTSVVLAGVMVVTNAVDVTSESKMNPFYDYVSTNINAVHCVSSGIPTSIITANILGNGNSVLSTKYQLTAGATYPSIDGVPIVGDFNAVLVAAVPTNAATKRQDHLEVTKNTDELVLSNVVGYLDFMPIDTNTQSFGNMVPGYAVMAVVTQVSCLGRNDGMLDSLLGICLGLTTLVPLIEQNRYRWAEIFEPFANESGTKASIGALGYEHDPRPRDNFFHSDGPFVGKLLNVVSGNEFMGATRQRDQLTAAEIARIYVADTPIIAMDITVGSPLARLQLYLAGTVPASMEPEDIQKAQRNVDAIVRELDAFSSGRFSVIWAPLNQSIVLNKNTILHSGFFTNGSGQISDIRSLNYLTALELTKGDMSAFKPFAAGLAYGSASEEDLANKRQALKSFLPQATITGTINRIYINPLFISALATMLVDCGLKSTIEGLKDFDAVANRSVYDNTFLRPIAGSSAFSPYAANVANNGNPFANFYSMGQ